jgi:hypothetical protein
MGRKGSQKNEQKVNESRETEARKREESARAALKALKKLSVVDRPENYDALVRQQRGKLKKALTDRRKSEIHSRKGKGGPI